MRSDIILVLVKIGLKSLVIDQLKYFSLKVKNIFTNIREFFSIFTYYLL